MAENSLTMIKVFLEASSKEELIQMQLKNNAAHGYRFIYGDPMKEDDSWVVWYFADINRHLVSEALKIEIKNNTKDDDVSS